MASRITWVWRVFASWWGSMTPLATDAWLYGGSAFFALMLGIGSWQPAQIHWGYLSVVPFTAAALLALAGPRHSGEAMHRWRMGVLALTFVGVVVVPLALEIEWRPTAQPEVAVVEIGGHALFNGTTPYRAWVDGNGHIVHQIKGVPKFESFFPYFPWMALFGLPSVASHELHGFSDARIAMSVFTCLLMLIALAMLRAPPNRKIRVAQVLVVLPTGALFLTTGGDDMPILALCLLSLVLYQRQRTVATGIALGVACAMKLTAWPFALAILAVSFARQSRRSFRETALAMAGVMAVAIIPYAIAGPRAFVANVIAFPLGLAGIQSPAASPLPGHVLASTFPALRHVILPAVFVVGGWFLVREARRRWPISLDTSMRMLAIVMAVVICSATATRIGYLIYPLNFMLWAWVVTPVETPDSGERVVLVEADSPGRSSAR